MPDAFALDEEGDRISVRDIIVRELVVKSLIHREYTSPHIARIVIDAGGIHAHNASRAPVCRFGNPQQFRSNA